MPPEPADCFLAVVDPGEAAVGVGVDEAGDLLGEVEDLVGEPAAKPARWKGRVGVEDVAPDVALGVEDLKAALCAVDRETDHDAGVELAGRNGRLAKVNSGNL